MLERGEWVRALMAVESQELLSLTATMSQQWKITPKTLPQAGLGMLKMRDSALQQCFYLGEFPLAMSLLKIVTDCGQEAEGAAQVLDDRLDIVEALAICDAVLANRLPGWQQIANLLEKGADKNRQLDLQRQQMLAATQVDFSQLDEADDVIN